MTNKLPSQIVTASLAIFLSSCMVNLTADAQNEHRILPCEEACVTNNDKQISQNTAIVLGSIFGCIVALMFCCCIARCINQCRQENIQNRVRDPLLNNSMFVQGKTTNIAELVSPLSSSQVSVNTNNKKESRSSLAVETDNGLREFVC